MPEDTSFWTETQTDWSQGDPGRVAMLFAAAYPDAPTIQSLASNAGLGLKVDLPPGTPQEHWQRVLSEASGARRAVDLAAEMLHDPASQVFHARLRHLLGPRLKEASWVLAARYGLPPQPTTGPDTFVTQFQAETESLDEEVSALPPTGALEALTAMSAGLQDFRSFMGTMNSATRRTVLIRVNGHPQGTGVLVAERLVLTACHVLSSTQWPPTDQSVEAVFDFVPEGMTSEAETGEAVRVVDFAAGSLPTPAEAGAPAPAPGTDWTATVDHLDFALLRLERTPGAGALGGGLPRGAFRITDDTYDYDKAPALFIAQHPLGDFQKISVLRNIPRLNALGSRVQYRGNTLKGSSGSPVIDTRGNLVAIHHYSAPGLNQGVPIQAIVRAVRDGTGGQELVEELAQRPSATPVTVTNPFATTRFMGRPFVNRAPLRETLESMVQVAGPVARTLVVQGDSGSGVSYSYRLASHAAECWRMGAPALGKRTGLRAHKIDLRFYREVTEQRRQRIESDLLTALNLEHLLEPLQQDARSITNLQTRLTRELSNSDFQWWLFIDSIDSVDAVKQWEVDELITALAQVVDEQQTGLRLVLAGREAFKFAQEHLDYYETDSPLGIVRGEVAAWFKARADEEKRSLDEARLAAKLEELFPSGGAVPRAADVAPQLPKALNAMWR